MFRKEIIYMGLNRNGDRLGSAGFLKVESRDMQSRLFLKLQNIPHAINGRFPIRIYNGADWKEVDGISVRDGGGIWESETDNLAEEVRLQIFLPEGYIVEGRSKNASQKTSGYQGKHSGQQEAVQQEQKEKAGKAEYQEQAADENHVMRQEQIPEQNITAQEQRETVRTQLAEMKTPQPVSVKEDKWEQILSSYDQIHPYGDERVYVKIEPGDFIILQSKYQHLVNNSFLLHGFYNYRYVILGKEDDYYLGVPGVFYKREKMVALMFGFEAFECEDGVAEEGKFGYYLRKVEL